MSHVQEDPSASDRTNAKIILIVDDNVIMREYLNLVLSEETPYKPVLVSDGFEALKIIGVMKPSLFILDYRMPGMNGIELYDRLHEKKEFEKTPAIMISIHLPKSEIAVRSLVGIQNPFERSELLTIIEALLCSHDPHRGETP
jgi:CheY-like chemotaxis protein